MDRARLSLEEKQNNPTRPYFNHPVPYRSGHPSLEEKGGEIEIVKMY